jgi:hypothetical protein
MRYALFSSVGKIGDALIESYDDLLKDEYLKTDRCFRYRAFSGASVKGDSVSWKADFAFYQEPEINPYSGGIHRGFPPLGSAARGFAEELVRSPEIRRWVDAEEFDIGCHQIRVTADAEHPGFPAPEGFHRDGFDFVAITCVTLDNVSGGNSLVRVDDEVIVDRTMCPGETLLLDDREVTHYVSPIMPKVPGNAARDVVVTTFSHDAA